MPRQTIAALEAKIRKLTGEVKDWRESVEEQRTLSYRKFAWAVIEDKLVAYKLAYDAWVDAKTILDSYLKRTARHATLCNETLAAGKLDPAGAMNALGVYEHAGLCAGNYANRLTAVESMRTVAISTLQRLAPGLNDDNAIIDKIIALVGEEAAKKLGGWQAPPRPLPPPDEGGRV
jgi:hypothetical protein